MKRGEVWWAEFDPAVGSQIRKTRPTVTMHDDAANRNLVRMVVEPLSSTTPQVYPGEALVTIGTLQSKATADQIMASDKGVLKASWEACRALTCRR